MFWKIESRWPSWSAWTSEKARPHGERYPFEKDTLDLCFISVVDALAAMRSLEKWNAGDYRIVKSHRWPDSPTSDAKPKHA